MLFMEPKHLLIRRERSLSLYTSILLIIVSVIGFGCDTSVVETSPFENDEASLVGVELSATSTADVNGDGMLDLLLTGWDGQTETSRLYLGDGQGGFRPVNVTLAAVALGSTSIADVNQDGNKDLLITGLSRSDTPISTLYLGRGDGTFEPANADLLGVALSSTSTGDVNRDGAPDLLVTGSDSTETPRSILYLGDGRGGFNRTDADLVGVDQGSTTIEDLNNDGMLDILITGFDESDTPKTRLYLGNGDGSFSVADTGFINVGNGSTSVGDIDGDGSQDVLITGWNDSTEVSTLYLGDGQGQFIPADAGLLGVEKSSTAMGDLTGNGIEDLVITGSNDSEHTTTVYLGTQGNEFQSADLDVPGLALGTTTLGDLNGDETLDMILTGQTDHRAPTVALYLGYGDGTFTQVTNK